MQDDKPVEAEEFDINSLANALLGKEEETKEDAENQSEEKTETKVETEESTAEEKEESADTKNDKTDESAESADESDNDEKTESESTEEAKPLSREDIKAALREEAEERERESSQRTTFAGQVREDLKEALKLDSTYTTVALDDGTPITSVTQLTQVINPETDEPYTREEAATLLLDAQRIVAENVATHEKRVDELTDLNVSFKEEADRVDALYGDVLKAFPDMAKELNEAYQKTFKMSADGKYVESITIPPLEFYGPALKPFRNAVDQMAQQEAEAKAAEARAAKEAEIKAEQEDRGDISGAAGSSQGKPDLLSDALDKYLSYN